jgi:uncharacterized protein (UPF0332 family)
MLTWEQWQEKSKSSLDASQILLENQKPVEAASRAYYAAYQMVTAVLIKLKLTPRGEFGNWSHYETQEMYRTHICRKTNLNYKDRRALSTQCLGFQNLFIARHKADYGFHQSINALLARTLWRDANRLVRLLENLMKRGVL